MRSQFFVTLNAPNLFLVCDTKHVCGFNQDIKGQMFKTLSKSFSTTLRNAFSKRTMSSRYFANIKPDYEQVELQHIEIPEQELKSYVYKLISSIQDHIQPVEKNAGDGIYLGTAGISYMFYHLSKIPSLGDKKSEFLGKAYEYLKPALVVSQHVAGNIRDEPSFILGNAGIYAIAAVIYHSMGDEVQSNNFRQMFYKAAHICKNPNFLRSGSDELFVGRAGYIIGALWMAKETNTALQTHDIYELCNTVIQSGRAYSAKYNSQSPLMYTYYQVEYLGAAHGLCSILQALLSVPGYLDSNTTDAADLKAAIDYLLTLQTKEGNFPAATDELGHEPKLIHWCHGAPGVVYLMAKAYLTFKEEKYLDSCKRMADLVWHKGLLRKGPSLCHGIAGNGYVFLLLYRLTDDLKYLHRALKFYEFLENDEFKNGARVPDNPYSLYEGIAGTVCFVGDLTCPKQAVFPFFEVF